jgi:hypothetical protein
MKISFLENIGCFSQCFCTQDTTGSSKIKWRLLNLDETENPDNEIIYRYEQARSVAILPCCLMECIGTTHAITLFRSLLGLILKQE